MRLLDATQEMTTINSSTRVQETQSPDLATTPKGSVFYAVEPAVTQLFNIRNEDQEAAA
jgi:hypothetical protein